MEQPRIELLKPKKLVGLHLTMSLSDSKTTGLWRSFMPRLKEIQQRVSDELFSLETYDADYFNGFDPGKTFEKWAAVEVRDSAEAPTGMDMVTVEGLYAVFVHRGTAAMASQTYMYIFTQWLPASAYKLDQRPHFALMGEKYRNNDPDSEEEVFIPIRPK